MATMLLMESQEDLATAIRDWFSKNHFKVEVVSGGLQAKDHLRQNNYDVIILEIALARLSGIEVIRDYRAAGGSSPILLMAAKHSSDELECGLDAGADMYVVKPFTLSNLAAQVRALMRRPALRSGEILKANNIAVNTSTGNVTKDDIAIHLHPMELKLLEFLLKHPNQLFSHQALSERIWTDNNQLSLDTVRTHIKTLRRKIDNLNQASIITTIRGSGYKIDSK